MVSKIRKATSAADDPIKLLWAYQVRRENVYLQNELQSLKASLQTLNVEEQHNAMRDMQTTVDNLQRSVADLTAQSRSDTTVESHAQTMAEMTNDYEQMLRKAQEQQESDHGKIKESLADMATLLAKLDAKYTISESKAATFEDNVMMLGDAQLRQQSVLQHLMADVGVLKDNAIGQMQLRMEMQKLIARLGQAENGQEARLRRLEMSFGLAYSTIRHHTSPSLATQDSRLLSYESNAPRSTAWAANRQLVSVAEPLPAIQPSSSTACLPDWDHAAYSLGLEARQATTASQATTQPDADIDLDVIVGEVPATMPEHCETTATHGATKSSAGPAGGASNTTFETVDPRLHSAEQAPIARKAKAKSRDATKPRYIVVEPSDRQTRSQARAAAAILGQSRNRTPDTTTAAASATSPSRVSKKPRSGQSQEEGDGKAAERSDEAMIPSATPFADMEPEATPVQDMTKSSQPTLTRELSIANKSRGEQDLEPEEIVPAASNNKDQNEDVGSTRQAMPDAATSRKKKSPSSKNRKRKR